MVLQYHHHYLFWSAELALCLFLGIIFAVPALTFWAIYSTRKRYSEFHQSCVDNQFTPPTDFVHDEGEEKQVRIVHGNV